MLIDVTVGIDIGGTNTVLGLVDRQGTCLTESSVPTLAQEDARSLVTRLAAKIREMHAPLSDQSVILGIGIGRPTRTTTAAPSRIRQSVVEGRHAPGGVLQGSLRHPRGGDQPTPTAAALGEMRFGAAQGMRDFIVITLGTGLGSGVVANGELIYGADGFAGEIGPHHRRSAGPLVRVREAGVPGDLCLGDRQSVAPSSSCSAS